MLGGSPSSGPGTAGHRDLTPQVRAWFTAAGFDELAFDALDTGPLSAVGANRLRRAPSAVLPAQPLFTFQV